MYLHLLRGVQDHFGADYAATAWIHSLVDCTTMLCGQYQPRTRPIPRTTSTSNQPTQSQNHNQPDQNQTQTQSRTTTTATTTPLGSLVGLRWSCRVAVMVGGVFSSCGLLLSSFTSSLELLYFTLGVLTGRHLSHLSPQLSHLSLPVLICQLSVQGWLCSVLHSSHLHGGLYFQQRKALAYGVAMSGSGIGTFVLAPLVQLLIESYSWRGALLILSAFVANLCVLIILTSTPAAGKTHPQTQKGRASAPTCCQSKEFRFLLLPDFLGLAVSFLFLASGCSLPFVYLVPYALSAGVSLQHAAFLMSILGVIDIVGNIITFGWLTDHRPRGIMEFGHQQLPMKILNLTNQVLEVKVFEAVPFGLLHRVCSNGGDVLLVMPLLLRSFPLLVPFAVLYGWLVDLTGRYTATFFLSGSALLASALILSTVVGIRHCYRCHHLTTVAKETKDTRPEALPLSLSDQSDSVNFNKEVILSFTHVTDFDSVDLFSEGRNYGSHDALGE
ncbi:hypothetical protein INR49_020880, partial [Caranx melampygus]